MRLPFQSPPVHRTAPTSISGGVIPSLDVGCLIGCLGTSALGCLFCLTNPVCWIGCAGPAAAACIAKCS